jgi:hypothetical protein
MKLITSIKSFISQALVCGKKFSRLKRTSFSGENVSYKRKKVLWNRDQASIWRRMAEDPKSTLSSAGANPIKLFTTVIYEFL